MLERLSDQEVAILQATKASENAMTAGELAACAKTTVENAQRTLDRLVEKDILRPYQDWDGTTRYLFPWDSEYAQAIYDELYGSLES